MIVFGLSLLGACAMPATDEATFRPDYSPGLVSGYYMGQSIQAKESVRISEPWTTSSIDSSQFVSRWEAYDVLKNGERSPAAILEFNRETNPMLGEAFLLTGVRYSPNWDLQPLTCYQIPGNQDPPSLIIEENDLAPGHCLFLKDGTEVRIRTDHADISDTVPDRHYVLNNVMGIRVSYPPSLTSCRFHVGYLFTPAFNKQYIYVHPLCGNDSSRGAVLKTAVSGTSVYEYETLP